MRGTARSFCQAVLLAHARVLGRRGLPRPPPVWLTYGGAPPPVLPLGARGWGGRLGERTLRVWVKVLKPTEGVFGADSVLRARTLP